MNTILCRHSVVLFAIICIILAAEASSGESAAADMAAITSTVNGFRDALQRGDRVAALNLLAPDVVILESGSAQTREEYAREHLAEDIAFAKVIPGTRSNLSVKQEGNIAWTTATTRFAGTFNGREVNSDGVELMVLTRTDLGWRIRAIHWSSHAVKKGG